MDKTGKMTDAACREVFAAMKEAKEAIEFLFGKGTMPLALSETLNAALAAIRKTREFAWKEYAT